MALCRATDDILMGSEGRENTVIVFFSISDIIEHTVLINQLIKYIGISGKALKQFVSHLSDRHLSIDNCISLGASFVFWSPTGISIWSKFFLLIYASVHPHALVYDLVK